MRILWSALRAVSVETMGVLAVLWMLQSVAGVAIDVPWSTLATRETASATDDTTSTRIARFETGSAVDTQDPIEVDATQRASLRQWFNTLFPAGPHDIDVSQPVARRAEFTRERLDHYRRHYGFATRGDLESVGGDLSAKIALADH